MSDMIIVDNLNFFSGWLLFYRFRSVRTVYFVHRSKGILDLGLIYFLKKRGWSFQQLNYSLSAHQGRSPMREVNKIMSDGMDYARQILSPTMKRMRGISDYERERLLTYFSRWAAEECYFMMELLAFLITKFQQKEALKTILLRKAMLSTFIRDLYEREHYKVCFYHSFFLTTMAYRVDHVMDSALCHRWVINIYGLCSKIGALMKALLCSFWRRLGSIDQKPEKMKSYSICAMVFNQRAIDLCNCLPWAVSLSNDSEFKKEILILSPSFFSDPVKEYYKKGDDFLEYDFNDFNFFGYKGDLRLKKSAPLFFNFFLKNVYRYRALYGLSKVRLYLLKHSFALLLRVSFFEALFSVLGSKVLWTMDEDGFDMQFASIAMHRLGGVSLGTSWSQILLPSWNIQRNQYDVFFAWGKRMVDIGLQADDLNRYFIIAGYPADHCFDEEIQKSKDFRSMICETYQKSTILTFIDNRAANDIMFSRGALKEVYEKLFIWLDSEDKNFLVIKTKNRDPLDDISSLRKKIDFLEKRKKIMIIHERGVLYPGLAADVVVGIASVTLISLLATLGAAVVFFDSHRLLGDFPLGVPIKTIWDIDELIPTLGMMLKEKQNISTDSLGDSLPRFLKGYPIDPFVDGRSAERISSYLKSLVEGYKENLSCEAVLNYANKKYTQEWGKETVVEGILQIKGEIHFPLS